MEFDHVEYFYLRTDKNERKGVIAMGYNKSKDELHITGSLCSPNDNFIARAGRNIALQRLHSNNARTRRIVITALSERSEFGTIFSSVIMLLNFMSKYILNERTSEVFSNCIKHIKERIVGVPA